MDLREMGRERDEVDCSFLEFGSCGEIWCTQNEHFDSIKALICFSDDQLQHSQEKFYTVQLDANPYSITVFRRVRKIAIGDC
jgi:hypothetical protein